jgi:hypothetical protein
MKGNSEHERMMMMIKLNVANVAATIIGRGLTYIWLLWYDSAPVCKGFLLSFSFPRPHMLE